MAPPCMVMSVWLRGTGLSAPVAAAAGAVVGATEAAIEGAGLVVAGAVFVTVAAGLTAEDGPGLPPGDVAGAIGVAEADGAGVWLLIISPRRLLCMLACRA